MRLLSFGFTAILALYLHAAFGATPEEEARFVAAARKAFEQHDADALVGLTCWDRVPDDIQASEKRLYALRVAQQVTKIELVSHNKYPHVVRRDKNGVLLRANLHIVKMLEITHAPKSDGAVGDEKKKLAQGYPVGEKDGKLYLLQLAPAEDGKVE